MPVPAYRWCKEASRTPTLFKDPLSDMTQNQRKDPLAVSGISVAIAGAGLVPPKISAPGIEFSQAEGSTLLLFLAAVISYFLSACLLYAWSDAMAWREEFSQSRPSVSEVRVFASA